MRLFELNANPGPGGDMCVLCGGSVRFITDTDNQPTYQLGTMTQETANRYERVGALIRIRNNNEN